MTAADPIKPSSETATTCVEAKGPGALPDAPSEPLEVPRAATLPRPVAVRVKRRLSGVRARMLARPTLRTALASAFPAWRLTAFTLAIFLAYFLDGLAPAAVVVLVFFVGEVALWVVRRARRNAVIAELSPSPPPASGERADS